MKSARIEILLLIAVLIAAVAANEAPLTYARRATQGSYYYPVIYPRSSGTLDGWILESGELTNAGGTMNSTSTVVIVGDNVLRRQYRSILSFNTSAYHIPSTAVIYQATLRIKLQGIVGSVPVATFGKVLVDMKKPSFGLAGLELSDFQATAGRYQAAYFQSVGSGWYAAKLGSVARAYINKAGPTQFRIYFKMDDDNDAVSDYLKFYSGNVLTVSLRPSLELNYYVP